MWVVPGLITSYVLPLMMSGVIFGLMTKARVAGPIAALSLLPALGIVILPLVQSLLGVPATPEQTLYHVGLVFTVRAALDLIPLIALLAARWRTGAP